MISWTRGVVAPALGVAFLVMALVIDLAVSAALFSGLWHGTPGAPGWSLRLVSCVVAGVASVVAAHLADQFRRRMQHPTRLAQDLHDALAGQRPR